jgi:hypothetical protein
MLEYEKELFFTAKGTILKLEASYRNMMQIKQRKYPRVNAKYSKSDTYSFFLVQEILVNRPWLMSTKIGGPPRGHIFFLVFHEMQSSTG